VKRGSSPGWTSRDEERQSLREQLRELMSERYATLDDDSLATLGLVPPKDKSDDEDVSGESGESPEERRRRFVTQELRRRLKQPRWGERGLVERRQQEASLLLLFHVFAQHEARRLLRDSRFQSLRRFHTGISGTSIRIAQVWAMRRRLRVQGLAVPINSDAELFGRRLAGRIRRSPSYTDHYNAACTFALVALTFAPIGSDSNRDEPEASTLGSMREWLLKTFRGLDSENLEIARGLNRKDLERVAQPVVRELRRAVATADSGTMAGRWDWIVSEDPDLAGLRDTMAFRTFESECFPSARPAPQRPSDVHHVELARHSARLVAMAARRYEQEWHRRAQLAEDDAVVVDIHEIQDWWEEEIAAWRLMERFTVDFRHWHMRLAVIRHVQSFALRHGQKPFEIAHPRYADDPLELDRGTLDELARRHVDAAGRRIIRLREFLAEFRELVDAVGPEFSWQRRLRTLDRRGTTLEREDLRRLCHAREAVWAGLATWFEAPVGSIEEVEETAAELMEAVSELPPVEDLTQDVFRDLKQTGRRSERTAKPG
jgi:hypothetical protein